MSPRILIVYGSRYGQTAKIGRRIRDALVARGAEVNLTAGDELPEGVDPAWYDGVVVGASVIGGGHQSYIRSFVERHRDALATMPSAFYSVSGSAGSPFPEARAEAERILQRFLEETRWHPPLTASVAGAMAYSRYNPLLRWWMRRIARRNMETDTSRDREYTDWKQVEGFALAFWELVGDARRSAAPVVPGFSCPAEFDGVPAGAA